MNVALYARVSTKNQQNHGTIDSQIEALRAYAKAQGVTIAEDYVCKDEGYSWGAVGAPRTGSATRWRPSRRLRRPLSPLARSLIAQVRLPDPHPRGV